MDNENNQSVQVVEPVTSVVPAPELASNLLYYFS